MTSQHIMADPLSLGIQYQLGNHRASCESSTIGSSLISSFELFFIGILISIVGAIVVFAVIGFSIGQPLVTVSVMTPYLFALTCITFIIAIYTFVQGMYEAMCDPALRVFVYENGLISVQQKSVEIISWQNVEAVWHEAVWHNITFGTLHIAYRQHTYKISHNNGKIFVLGNKYKKRREFWKIIEEETTRHLFSAALKTYQMGQAVVFGPLTATNEGLCYGTKRLPWNDVKSIKVSIATLDIRMREKGLSWARVTIPNVEVFKMLVSHITGLNF